jgi:exonuclease III
MYDKKPSSMPWNDGPRNGKWSNEILMGTWNVQTMLQLGRMIEIAQEIMNFNLALVALQEIRWQGQGRIDKSKYTLIYSGPSNKTGPLGTAFILTKRIRDSLLEVELISGRLCRIRIKGIFSNITIIETYAPTEVKEEYEKEEFYHMLERTCERVPKHDQIIILGNFNAQIGEDETTYNVSERYTLHPTSNANGSLLIQFALRNNL